MLVRLVEHLSGMVNGQPVDGRGSVVDVPDDDAARYVRLGYAELVAEPEKPPVTPVETATEPPAHVEVRPRPAPLKKA